MSSGLESLGSGLITIRAGLGVLLREEFDESSEASDCPETENRSSDSLGSSSNGVEVLAAGVGDDIPTLDIKNMRSPTFICCSQE